MNIAAPNSQAVIAGNGNVATNSSSSFAKIDSNEFGSLIATLLGLNAPNQNANISNVENPPKQALTAQDNIPNLANLGLATFNVQTANLQNGQKADPSVLSSIADLLKAIDAIEGALSSGQPIDQKNIENALTAINGFLAKLDSIFPSPISSAVSGVASQFQAQTGQAGQNTSANILEMAKGLLTQIQPVQETLKAFSAKEVIANLEQLAKNLTQTAQATNQPQVMQTGAAAELAQKLQQLTQKLTDISPLNLATKTANSSTLNISAENPITNETAKTLLAMLNGKNAASQSNAELSSPKLETPEVINIKAPKTSNINTPNANTSAQQEVAKAMNANSNSAPTLMAAASLTSMPSAATKPDVLAQSDALLLSQNISQNNINNLSANIKPATALYQGAAQTLNLPHVAYEFARNVSDGLSRFQIHLNPAEMGRIDVKMEIDKNGALNARLVVERAETLDLLQRDVRALERALSQAGLDSNKTNLEFSLKQDSFAGQNNDFGTDADNFADAQSNEDDKTEAELIAQMPGAIIYHSTASPGGLNITA